MSKPAKADKAKAPATNNSSMLTRDAAASELGLSRKTLDNWRVAGRGPKFCKLGARVLYPQSEIDAYKARNLRQSTCETKLAA